MRFLRSNILSKFAALIVGVVFLNTGFVLFELRSLDLQYSKQEMQDIITLVNSCGFEEEKDSAQGSVDSLNELGDLHLTSFSYAVQLCLLRSTAYCQHAVLFIDSRPADITTPPPKA